MHPVKYTFHHPDGSVAGHVNQVLLKKQKVSDEKLKEIIAIHEQKLAVYAALMNGQLLPTNDVADMLTAMEYDLQDAWGFERDINKHGFWDVPNGICKCPVMDNKENWPTGPYWVSADCPLHGTNK